MQHLGKVYNFVHLGCRVSCQELDTLAKANSGGDFVAGLSVFPRWQRFHFGLLFASLKEMFPEAFLPRAKANGGSYFVAGFA